MTRVLHRFELRLAVMAVMALLIAQLGALSHSYAHDAYAQGTHSRNTHAHGAAGLGEYGRAAFEHDAYGLAAPEPSARGHDVSGHDDFAGSASIPAGADSHDPCSDCLAYAPLLSAAGTTNSLPFALPQGRIAAGRPAARSLIDRSPLLAFRSRAPPSTPWLS